MQVSPEAAEHNGSKSPAPLSGPRGGDWLATRKEALLAPGELASGAAGEVSPIPGGAPGKPGGDPGAPERRATFDVGSDSGSGRRARPVPARVVAAGPGPEVSELTLGGGTVGGERPPSGGTPPGGGVSPPPGGGAPPGGGMLGRGPLGGVSPPPGEEAPHDGPAMARAKERQQAQKQRGLGKKRWRHHENK